MACPYREGKKKCTWMIVSGCINPCVAAVIKEKCDGNLPRYKTEGTLVLR